MGWVGRSLLWSLALLACGQPHGTAPIASNGSVLVDQQGREVILRGVNIRAAGFFDIYKAQLPLPPFTADDCRIVGQELGMNQLRLPISWSLVEPSRGDFDTAFLKSVVTLAGECARQGVYTLVDLHQDGWSKFVGADGAPFWAHDPPLPASAADQSMGNQPSTGGAVQAAFNGFFGNAQLMQDYATMAATVAKTIDQQPGIIGLEIMNEPFGTSTQLDGFYAVVSKSVRAAAPDLPLYFEPNAIRNILDASNPDPLSVANTVYSPHLYTGVFQGNWMVGQDSRIADSISNMQAEESGTRAALMVTEFGNNPADPVGAAWLTAALRLLDQYAVSASFWVYEEWPSTCGNPSCWGLYDEAPIAGAPTFMRTLRPEAVTVLARAFPRAIAGHLDSFTYDATTRQLTVRMHGASGTHILAAPMRVYPNGVTVSCDGHSVAATRNGSQVSVACAGSSLIMSPGN
jgi:hypothetical protein